MTWIKFHGEIRKGKHRGIPRALRFVFLELSHEARELRGIVVLPAGMGLVEGVHDILGGDRREVKAALELYTKGPDPDAPSIIVEGETGSLRLRIPSWEAWNSVDDSVDRVRKFRAKKRELASGNADVTRYGNGGNENVTPPDQSREDQIRSDPPVGPPDGGKSQPEEGRGEQGGTPDEPPAQKPKRARARKQALDIEALAESWEPNEGHYAVGVEEGLSRAEVLAESQKWLDYQRNSTKPLKNPDASFRNWLRNAKNHRPKRPSAPGVQRPAGPGEFSWKRSEEIIA